MIDLTRLTKQIENSELDFHDILDDGIPVDISLAEELALITVHSNYPTIWQTTGEAATKLGIKEKTLRILLRKMYTAMQNGQDISGLTLEWKDPLDEQCRIFKLLTRNMLMEL